MAVALWLLGAARADSRHKPLVAELEYEVPLLLEGRREANALGLACTGLRGTIGRPFGASAPGSRDGVG